MHTNRLTIVSGIKTEQKTDHSWHTRHKNTFSECWNFVFNIWIAKFGQFNVDEIEKTTDQTTKTAHEHKYWQLIPCVYGIGEFSKIDQTRVWQVTESTIDSTQKYVQSKRGNHWAKLIK